MVRQKKIPHKKKEGGFIIIPSLIAAITTGVVVGKKNREKAKKAKAEVLEALRDRKKSPEQKQKELEAQNMRSAKNIIRYEMEQQKMKEKLRKNLFI